MRNQSCNLPLLDGTRSSDHAVSAQAEVQHVEKILYTCQNDNTYLQRIVCAAWALLLRCYTGQNQIAFLFNCLDDSIGSLEVHGRKDQPDILQMTLEEGENLSQTICMTAEIIRAARESKRSVHHPQMVNTGVEFETLGSSSEVEHIKANRVSIAMIVLLPS